MTRHAPIRDYVVLAFFFALAAGLQAYSARSTSKSANYLNPPPEMIEYFTFGFRESMADSLWLRWIQDGDRCQTYTGAPVTPEPTFDPKLAVEYNNPRHKNCDHSWSFKMLDAVTKLAPRFKMPYHAGTMTLAVLVEDYVGATALFDRGVENYPDDWQILYRAGYHFLFDIRDLKRAGELMNRAADHGAPYWVKFLAAQLYSRAGQAALGIATLESYLKTLTDDRQRDPVIKRIADLRKDLAAARTKGP